MIKHLRRSQDFLQTDQITDPMELRLTVASSCASCFLLNSGNLTDSARSAPADHAASCRLLASLLQEVQEHSLVNLRRIQD